ncbi:Putative pyridoxal 5'-phosphate synthase subunit PdxT/SNO, class I glutamine amidotransferase [Septoria linicola]|uniref:glutaminase n=1 Tax=Septoria linicola TaxID=215465 RepID=A0A9Q9AXV7_9PEZI|nr:putative pyridoxal 5'-phosphate synthase subunit PdxT/SNO, class I glutamine amidotransferase [Septoria linicola]USW52631.1 Putative pyridoxal 5'-phosphate synthase subunit PdxT/SNO, class I glutamine amidotransferase [Septoria linicola]
MTGSFSAVDQSTITVGVLALQGAFVEHITLLKQAAPALTSEYGVHFTFLEVRTAEQLERCDALILPGGESTAISLIAERCGLLEPLRQFVKLQRRPTWGTCAGLILLAEEANKSKATGQELIGGLDVRVHRNYFGRQVESFEAALDLPFLGQEPFHSVFIRAPVVENVLASPTKDVTTKIVEKSAGENLSIRPSMPNRADTVSAPQLKATSAPVEILGRLPGRAKAIKDKTTTAEELGEEGDIVAVKQGNVFGTSFHPELAGDERIHAWWLREVIKSKQAT